jgi:hypothetical protein
MPSGGAKAMAKANPNAKVSAKAVRSIGDFGATGQRHRRGHPCQRRRVESEA